MRGHEDKLSDEVFWRLSETGDALGWELFSEADFAVRADEWEEIARLIAVANEKLEISWASWKQERLRVKISYLERYLAALYSASRLVTSGQGAAEILDRFLIPPLGFYLCGDLSATRLADVPVIIIRLLFCFI